MERFSKKYGYTAQEKEISIREDAPIGLRQFIIQTLYVLDYKPSEIRPIICQTLRFSPNDGNWSDFPNIDSEIRQLIEKCEWFQVYDIIEAVYSKIHSSEAFAKEINEYFKVNGIGWKLGNGQIIFRGNQNFEQDLSKAEKLLDEKQLNSLSAPFCVKTLYLLTPKFSTPTRSF